jgi:hypothetical protein
MDLKANENVDVNNVDLKANENVNVNKVGRPEMRKQMFTKMLCKWQYVNAHENCKKK